MHSIATYLIWQIMQSYNYRIKVLKNNANAKNAEHN